MTLPPKDPRKEEEKGLAAARQRLLSTEGRPFEVDKILADHRAKEEKNRERHQAIAQKLEDTIKEARQKREETQVQKAEQEALARTEKKLRDLKMTAEKKPQKENRAEKSEKD